jgi:hypothetical protein
LSYKKAELMRMGFSADGETAYCDVRLAPGSLQPGDLHGTIDVKVYVPIKPSDTLATIQGLATDAAVQMLRTATR